MGRKKSNHVHEYLLYDEVSNTSKCLIEGCDTVLKGNHGSNMMRHFGVFHPDAYQEILLKNNMHSQDDSIDLILSTPKPKNIKLDNYLLVRQCCIDLVAVHGRPLSLFDDSAFREMINLIPMSTKEKSKLTSRAIAKALKCEETSETEHFMRTIGVQRSETIKGETTEECTCNATTDNDIVKHRADCAVAADQPYSNYFEIEVDMATCTLCKESLPWTNISELKEHLESSHAAVPFKDDDEEFERGAPETLDSSVDSRDDEIKVILVDENIMQKNTKQEIRTKFKKPIISSDKGQTSNEQPSDWSTGLDRFGLYVSSLMKFLPKDKCIKFQSQIVQRLLQEQASAA